MFCFQASQCVSPRSLVWFFYRRKISGFRFFGLAVTLESSAKDVFPPRNVQDDLPNAVRIPNRLTGRLLGRHSFQRVMQRRAMPGVLAMNVFQLLNDGC